MSKIYFSEIAQMLLTFASINDLRTVGVNELNMEFQVGSLNMKGLLYC